ncbi:MAG: extracellular solute-binding protein [Candidatus Vecturithrix sp.]|nr:extracellular solute-binding protein [Candidatus Vecturithrix sp.]
MKRAALFIVCVLTCGMMLSGTALAAKEITFLFMPDAPQDVYLPWMQEKAVNFEAETGVKVNVEVVSWGDAWTRISTTVATGEGADVFQVGTTWNPQFAATGGLAEVDIAEFGGKDVFMPANLDSTTYKDKHYGVPWFAETRVLFYNKDMFAEAGITELPKSQEDIITVGKQLVEKFGEGKAIAIAGTNAWDLIHNWAIILWGNGGTILHENNTEAAFNSQAGVDAMKWYVRLLQEGLASKACAEYNQPQADAAFINGNVAMVFMGPWNIAGIEHDNPGLNYDVIEPPMGPAGKASFSGGSNLAILEASPNKDAAKAWIQYLLKDEIAVDHAKNLTHMMPSKISAYADPYYESGVWSTFKTVLGYATAYPPLGVWGDIERAIQEGFTATLRDYIDGKYTEDTAKMHLDKAVAAVNAALAKE